MAFFPIDPNKLQTLIERFRQLKDNLKPNFSNRIQNIINSLLIIQNYRDNNLATALGQDFALQLMNEDNDKDPFYDLIFETRNLLTYYFPQNQNFLTVNGLIFLDPISKDSLIPTPSLVALSDCLFRKESLNAFYKRSDAYRIDEKGNVRPISPPEAELNNPTQTVHFLNERETTYLLNNQVEIFKPSKAFLESAVKSPGFVVTDITEQDYEKKLRRRILSQSVTAGFKYVGIALAGIFAAAVIAATIFFAPPVSPLLLGVLFGTSLATALVGKLSSNGHFMRDFAYSLVINWLALSAIALALPLATISLASLGVLSPSAYFSTLAAIPLVIALTPAAMFLMEAVAQVFKSDAVINFNRSVINGLATITTYLFGAIGAGFGLIVGGLRNAFRPKIEVPQPALLADFVQPAQGSDNSNQNNNGFTPNVGGIQKSLNIDPLKTQEFNPSKGNNKGDDPAAGASNNSLEPSLYPKITPATDYGDTNDDSNNDNVFHYTKTSPGG